MNQIVEELEKKSIKTTDQQVDMAKQAKLLLSANDSEDRKVLNSLGLDFQIEYIETQNSEAQQRQLQREIFKKPVVTIDELEIICLKYRLYMRNTRMYIGSIPPYLGAALKRFINTHGIVIGGHKTTNDRFYMIAPPEMFSDYPKFSDVLGRASRKARENFGVMLQSLVPKDPIILYKTDDGNYCIVESWGNDFGLVRQAKALMVKPQFIWSILIPIMYLLIPYLFFRSMWFYIPDAIGLDLSRQGGWFDFYRGTAGLLTIAFAAIYCVWFLFWNNGLRDLVSDFIKSYETKRNWHFRNNS